MSYADTTFGYTVLHDDDDGFLIYRCGADFEMSGWNSTEAHRWLPSASGGFFMWAQVPVTKRIFLSSATDAHPALLEVLP
ncbi:MAG: hypothetical protein Q8L93_03245 [Rhodocyclaceae bacterium]|nr:hypothetical protein [Rhodocyclaceae bacterium]